MIYAPLIAFNVARALGESFIATLLGLVADFLAGSNKPWTYYAGNIFGYSAMATGIPGAAATLYVIGDTVDLLLFKSPDGSDVRIFLNGINHVSIDTYAAAAVWETVNIGGLIGGVKNRIDIVNYGPSANANATGVMWLGLGPVQVTGANAQIEGVDLMAYDTIAIRLQDDEQNSPLGTFAVHIPTGSTLAQVQTYLDAIAAELDAVTGCKIVEANVTFNLTLPGGLKATPDTNILAERGGLVAFNTAGPRKGSVRIPGIKYSVMPGDTFDVEAAPVGALVTRLLTSTTAGNIRPVSDAGYNFTAALAGKKSFRK